MGAIGSVLGVLLLLFELVLIVRVVVDWMDVLSPGPAPAWRQQARRVTHGATEWALAPVRRVLPPVRAGSMGFDLALPVVFILVLVLRAIVGGF
jgi:YggT family protein